MLDCVGVLFCKVDAIAVEPIVADLTLNHELTILRVLGPTTRNKSCWRLL